MADVITGDCLEVMRGMESDSVDAVVCDPPYELGFMGKRWDASGVAYDVDLWREALRVAKPGAHLLAFGGSRTSHRMVCAVEDAGWEIRDSIMWLYGSGFPKSLDVSKAIDKAAGAEREVVGDNPNSRPNMVRVEASVLSPRVDAPLTAPATAAARKWHGWGTALKPAHEPIVVARKPLDGTVAANVLAWGTGALNVDGCRVGTEDALLGGANRRPITRERNDGWGMRNGGSYGREMPAGRWPANIIHDGSEEATNGMGEASRYYYCAKASKKDRGEGNIHATVKPTDLMRYLCRLVTPPGGLVLDPFTGSGSTGKAAVLEGFRFIGIELDPRYAEIARARIAAVHGELFAEAAV